MLIDGKPQYIHNIERRSFMRLELMTLSLVGLRLCWVEVLSAPEPLTGDNLWSHRSASQEHRDTGLLIEGGAIFNTLQA